MTTEAPVQVEPKPVVASEMRVELDRRLAAMEAPKVDAKPVAESAVGGKPAGIVAEKGSVAADPVKPGSPAVASEPVKPVDLSFVDDAELRSVLEKADPKVIERLRKEMSEGKLRFADYTKKTTAIADERKALDALKHEAELGGAIMSDQEALEALDAINKRRKGEKAPEPFDYQGKSSEEIEAHVQAVTEAKAKAIVAAELRASREADTGKTQEAARVTSERTEITGAALDAFKSMGHEEKDFVSVVDPIFRKLGGWDGMAAIAKARGEAFSKDFVVATLRDFIPPTNGKVKPGDSPRENGSVVSGAVGASALTRGSGTASPNNLPKHVKEGRVVTHESPRDERIADALYEANRIRLAKGLAPITTD